MRQIFSTENHRISCAVWVPSPHFDDRPTDDVDLIVIHAIALPPKIFNPLPVLSFFQGTLDNKSDPFFDEIKKIRVSSHLVIGRLGEVYQTVEFNKRAWHAGESEFAGRQSCNDFSIGIELIGHETGPFTNSQYETLSAICKTLCESYQISSKNIVGHRDIAPDRKLDPGEGFDYARVRP